MTTIVFAVLVATPLISLGGIYFFFYKITKHNAEVGEEARELMGLVKATCLTVQETCITIESTPSEEE